eukprot:TRINITY_DN31342_c0_g1_i1.p1 TRINITY_DN31342_c0_g1~~TRINITY_DN31342_c0_g1_i1.p1  ORF type:complete len:851 (+),score=249.08 TRINITY_DN31342_c0_g1_i1:69-2555(+)
MGCGSSVNPAQVKLEDVETKCNALKAKGDGVGKEGLDEVTQISKELSEIFEDFVKTSNMDALNRIGVLSDMLLDNLMSRLKVDLLKLDGADDIIKQILSVGKNLDGVRSSPATKKLEACLEPLRQQAPLHSLKKMQEGIKGLTKSAELPDCLTEILKELAVVSSKPLDKKLADQTLAICKAYTAKAEKGFPGLLQGSGIGCVSTMKDLASQFDKACDKVKASSPDAAWDPFEPKLDKLVDAYSHKELDKLGNKASAELQRDGFSAALEAMASMQEWWAYGKDSPERPQEIENLKALFALAEKQTLEACASPPKDVDLADVAQTLDEQRKAFAGLPAADGDGLAAMVKIQQAELSAAAAATVYTDPLNELRAELDKGSGQSLATMLKATERVASVIDKVPADALESVTKACEDLEAWVREAASKSSRPDKLEGLCKFATRYDATRAKLPSPPVPLLPELQELACASNLSAAEEELSKETGLNPSAVLEFVKSVGQYLPAVGLSEGSRDKLQAVIAKTTERVSESHQKALADGAEAKLAGLLKFAETFDAAVTAASGEAELSGKLEAAADAGAAPAEAEPAEAAADAGEAPVEAEPAEAEPEKPAGPSEAEVAAVTAKIEEADAELAQETGLNPNNILQVLSSIEPLWEPVAESEELKARLVSTFGSLQGGMATACAGAAADDNEAKLKALMAFAQKVDGVQAKLGSCAPGFCRSVAQAGAAQDLADAGTELAKETGMNPTLVIKNLRHLKQYWEQIGGDDQPGVQELHGKLGELCSTMRERIKTSYTENPAKREGLLKFAATYDTTITDLAGAGNPDLQSELSALDTGS